MQKQVSLLTISAVLIFMLSSCGTNHVGFYGICGFKFYPITVKKDGSFTVDHGNINPWSYGRWTPADGGIMVTGLTGEDAEDNGLWKEGKNEGLISPSGRAYCKSAYTPD
jgi:hypothetical protein